MNKQIGDFEFRHSQELQSPKAREERIDRVAIEFQPDEIVVSARRLPTAARIALYTILALFLLCIVWAFWAKMDKIVVVPGKLVSQSRTIVLHPIKPSVIRSIDVKKGDAVQSGKILATLDRTLSQADKQQIQTRLVNAKSILARIDAEISKGQFVPNSVPGQIDLQKRIFDARQQTYSARLSVFTDKTAALEATISSAAAQIEQVNSQIDLAEKQLTVAQSLEEKGLMPTNKVLELNANLEQLGLVLLQRKSDSERARFEIDELESSKNEFIANWAMQLAEEKAARSREIAQLELELQKASVIEKSEVFRAPRDAVVLDITPKSIGSLVQAGEMVISLVPAQTALEIKMEIAATDIGWVQVGQTARVKLDPFPFQRHGTLSGTISKISPDAFTKNTNGISKVYYQGTIRINEQNLRLLPNDFALLPGITLSAEIKVGTNTVINYVLDPLTKALDESLKEP